MPMQPLLLCHLVPRKRKKGGMIRTLLTSQLRFDVVEELGDLLQIAEGQPGEARSGLSLLQQLGDVCRDDGEHLLQSLRL